ncbi:hypothetical protein [Enterococcus sp. 5H]|uniref:hypothetical protein n=1 Tax=Enterococcus sp. 5H TaxID=1229490 RepID=UPI0023038177|nr:hypothetical protein [Enterococcus sp. 5H]MDA9471228.1 putative DnaJ-class molecular chaperone [Enterococcus sp. 5H]
MNPWKILEIAETSDKKAIKRAYAAKLKTIFPDEQPEEFQQLKTAFDLALHLSKISKTEPDNDYKIEPVIISDTTNSTDSLDYTFQKENSFSENLHQLVATEDYFDDLSGWKNLTSSINHWSIDEYMNNSYTIQLFLVENYPCLSRNIIRSLFQTFDLFELTDHIGQERFISTDFIYLKNNIYNVPPFSFQVASKIPKENRKRYFFLRYNIYQAIVNRKSYNMDISVEISDCAELFSEDSELWNLQMIDLLDTTNGLLNTTAAKTHFKILLDRTKSMNSNPTTVFLNTYYELLNKAPEKLKTEAFDNWHKEELTISDDLFFLLLSLIFIKTQKYSYAFNFWKQLDSPRRNLLLKQIKKIYPHLSKQEKKEFRKIRREERKKKERPVLTTLVQLFFFPAIVAFFVLLSNISMLFSNSSEQKTYDSTDFQTAQTFYEEDSEEEIVVEDKKELYEGTLTERFAHYFYASNDPEGKQLFIDTCVTNYSVKELLQEYVDKDTAKYNDDSNFKFESNTINNADNIHAIYNNDELLCILKATYSDSSLEAVYGNDWQSLPEDQFQQLQQSTLINPESSTYIFIKKFLFSDKKQENLLQYSDYLSENVKKVIENNLNEPTSGNLKKGFLYLVKEPSIKFIVSDQDSENEEKLILTFDEQGRVDHVFGPHWEEVKEEMIHYPNRAAFKNIRTLLEEPD